MRILLDSRQTKCYDKAMLDSNLSTAQIILVSIIPVLFAIVLHEVAHGWAAYKLGDKTAYMLGRLSLNPIKHIDPVGTILVPAVLLLTAGFAFGWAKPVPIDWRNLGNPKRDTAIVALAGPAANLGMAIVWVVLTLIATLLPPDMSVLSEPLLNMAVVGVFFNILLMVFNLIPIPPTDGGRIAVSLLPANIGSYLSRIEPYGLIIIVVLMLTGVLWKFIMPIIQTLSQLLYSAVGL